MNKVHLDFWGANEKNIMKCLRKLADVFLKIEQFFSKTC